MSGEARVKVAIIGAGWMARAGHCPSLREIEEVELAGICDVQQDKAEALAESFGIPAAYADYRAMLEEVAPDAVYVVIPAQLVYDIMRHCLEAGLDVFVEKPPGITPNQTRIMAALAEAKGCKVQVGFNRRFVPLLVEARRRVEEQGPMHQCEVTFYKDKRASGEIGDPYHWGGCEAVYLEPIHAIDALRWLGGEPAVVHAAVRAVDADYPNTHAAIFEYESGAVGILNHSWAAGGRMHTFQMHAVGASAYVEPGGSARIFTRGSKEPAVITSQGAAGSDEFHRCEGFFAESRHFIDCILKDEQPQPGLTDAVRTMELCDTILRAGWNPEGR